MASLLSLASKTTIAAVTSLALCSTAIAEVDFTGKTIEWIVPFGPGGGTDTWARYNAPLLKKHLPGNPSVIVVNQPGGGSTKGANIFTARAQPDGLTILGTSSSTQFPYLLGDPRVRYEYRDWNIVLASSTGGVVYVSPELGIKNPEDISKLAGQKLVYASQGATSLDIVPILSFGLLGLDVKHVFGFKGRGEGRLAFERGESNIDFQNTSAYLKNVVPLVEAGQAVPLFSWGGLDTKGEVVRDPTFPELPSFPEAYKKMTGKAPEGQDYEAYLAFFTAGFPAAKMVLLPEGTDTEIIQTYRDAFNAVLNDPEYIETSGTILGKYSQVTGAAADKIFEIAIGVPNALKENVIQMLEKDFGAKLK